MGGRESYVTFVADSTTFLHLLGKACKIYDPSSVVGVDVKKFDPWTKVVHELAECPGRNGPVVSGFFLVELGVDGGLDFVWEGMRSRDSYWE